MEIGAVIGAAPKKNVIREVPSKGDVIILLGGRTGRDGIGGYYVFVVCNGMLFYTTQI